jgi:SAM-dependent methyltransferase
MRDGIRMYGDLAWLWPVLSPKEDYVEVGEFIASAIREHSRIEVRTLLHLGCGGGHNDFTLKKHFKTTGVDASPDMLNLAGDLNPEVEYIEGDMRSVRLGRRFDAVILLDSVAYMLSEGALRAALATAHEHLKAGGTFLSVVEMEPAAFVQNRTDAWTNTRGEIELTFVENYYDPDPSDSTYECTFLYLIRERGKLRIETDRHVCSMFPMETWRRSFESVGFEIKQVEFRTAGKHEQAFPVLLGLKPGG